MSASICSRDSKKTKDTLRNSALKVLSSFVQARVVCFDVVALAGQQEDGKNGCEGMEGCFVRSQNNGSGLRLLVGADFECLQS